MLDRWPREILVKAISSCCSLILGCIVFKPVVFFKESALHSPIPFSVSQMSWLVGMACGLATGVHAQTANTSPAAAPVHVAVNALKEVVVSGSRNEQAADELPMTMDVVNAQGIEQGQMQDIRDIAKDLPNVSVSRAPARFGVVQGSVGREGNAGFNIRGLDGNRVLLLVDGIRTPRSYGFGVNAFGRDTLSVDLIKRVELIKGPASVLYGSDGIAGLVNFITYEPSDFLAGSKRIGGKVAISFSGDDKGNAASATLAGRATDTLDWQITAATNKAVELSNRGDNYSLNRDRTAPNPQSDSGNGVLAKVVIKPTPSQKHLFTFEHVGKSSNYELLTARAKPPLAATSVLRADALTTMDRNRLTWEARYALAAPVADSLQMVLSLQNTNSREYAFEDRNTAADRTRDTTYQERTFQASAQAGKTIRMSRDWVQKLTYGVDHTKANVTNLQTGVVPPAGETFPLKRFPDTVESSTALYVQDEMVAGNWSLTPGVRVDNFSIQPSQDGFTVPVAALSGWAVSPKLGVLYRATSAWSFFGNYASGFRAPNAGQVNAFFENVTQFYKTIPNSALKPEKSQNFEFGARGRLDQLTLDAAMFAGRFTDLIEDNRQVGGTGAPGNPTIFQSVNINNATISGFEVKGAMDWGKVGVGKLSTVFVYGVAHGKVSNTGLPLDSIDPAKLSVGVRYESAQWSVRLNALHHAAKKVSDMGQQVVTLPMQFATPASTAFDLAGQWRFTKSTRLNASIVNLTNQKYWRWSDVRGVQSNAVFLDAFTQPGRKLNLSLVTEF